LSAIKWKPLFDDSENLGDWRPSDPSPNEVNGNEEEDWVDDIDAAEEEEEEGGLSGNTSTSVDDDNSDDDAGSSPDEGESEGEESDSEPLSFLGSQVREQGVNKPSPPKINTAEEARVYNRMKGKLTGEDFKKWGDELKAEALQATLQLHHKQASERECIKAADAAQKEMESYVSTVAYIAPGLFVLKSL
jgi:hypothetical protein